MKKVFEIKRRNKKMTDKINQLKQKAIEEFEKRFITSVDWGFNFNMKDFEIFMHFYQDELEKVVREEIIREIDKVYKDERGINNWLDLREKILPPQLKNKRGMKSVWKLKKVCGNCGKPFVPDKEAMIFGTKKWDGHTYKYNCDCLKNKNIRISIG